MRSARRLGAELRAGDVVVLSGPLGAGKTVLAKGIAQAMDVEGAGDLADVRAGPRAPAPGGRMRPAMIHVDLYRLLDQTSVRPARRARLAGPRHRSRGRRRGRRMG